VRAQNHSFRYFAFVEANTTGTGELFIQKAKELGLTPILLAKSPAKYTFATEGNFDVIECATDDEVSIVAALETLCRKNNGSIAGLYSSSEFSVSTATKAARKLNLNSADPRAISRARDKSIQRDVVSTCAPELTPKFHLV
jgi:hypothetical protein